MTQKQMGTRRIIKMRKKEVKKENFMRVLSYEYNS